MISLTSVDTVSEKREKTHASNNRDIGVHSSRWFIGPLHVRSHQCDLISLPTGHCPSLNRIRGRPIWLHSLNALRLPISVFSLFARVLVRAAPRYRASGIWSMLLVSREGRKTEKGKTEKNKEEESREGKEREKERFSSRESSDQIVESRKT